MTSYSNKSVKTTMVGLALFAFLVLASIGAPQATASDARGDGCDVGKGLKYLGHSWFGKEYRYNIIRSSFPREFDKQREKDRVVARIRDGFKTWERGRNDCHYRRHSGFGTQLDGQSGSSATNNSDSINTVDFASGDPCGSSGATNRMTTACVRVSGRRGTTETKAGTRRVPREVDMRFNSTFRFHIRLSHRGCSNRFDLFELATHEAGHVVGLADLYGRKDQWLTMFGTSDECQYRRRFLARSDWLGLTRLYTSR